VKCLLADGTGSIRLKVDSAGTVLGKQDFDAWGTTTNQTGEKVAFGYRGEWKDSSTGLIYLRARWMDPENGRFASVDPFTGFEAIPVSMHRFVYANSNPVHFIDPSGNVSLVELTVAVAISGQLASRFLIPAVYQLTDVTTRSAYFAKRPLMTMINKGLSTLANISELIEWADVYNVEMVHEQIFFNDKGTPSNVGYMGHYTLDSDDENVRFYRKSMIGFRANLLRKAVDIVSLNLPKMSYDMVFYNCQDFAQQVRAEYYRTRN